MIVTLTLNPCLDLNLEVERFRFDEHVRALVERKRPGGKGINVSVVLGLLGLDSVAVAPLGGPSGEEFSGLAGKDLVRAAVGEQGSHSGLGKALLERVSVAAPTRTNTVITSRRDGRHFKVNQQGRPLTSVEFGRAVRQVRSLVRPGDWLVLAGSLPPGAPAATYADLIREFHARGCFVALDADGEAFRVGVQAGPDVVKPNRQELERFAGKPLRSRAAVLSVAQEILRFGTRLCLVSDGARPAWLVTPDQVWKGIPPRAEGSPTGAGDATLAGFLAGLMGSGDLVPRKPHAAAVHRTRSTSSTSPSATPERAFRLALACGAAAASTPDTEYFSSPLLRKTLKAARVERIA
jgi:1-phosphofructokinase